MGRVPSRRSTEIELREIASFRSPPDGEIEVDGALLTFVFPPRERLTEGVDGRSGERGCRPMIVPAAVSRRHTASSELLGDDHPREEGSLRDVVGLISVTPEETTSTSPCGRSAGMA